MVDIHGVEIKIGRAYEVLKNKINIDNCCWKGPLIIIRLGRAGLGVWQSTESSSVLPDRTVALGRRPGGPGSHGGRGLPPAGGLWPRLWAQLPLCLSFMRMGFFLIDLLGDVST